MNGLLYMARPRVIDQNDILDAAERVVIRNGAAQLTLDAVALQAGISKASVIYDYKTKQQLIKAIISRRLEQEKIRIQAHIDALGPAPDVTIRGLISAASTLPDDDLRAVAGKLSAAMALDEELRGEIEDHYHNMIASVMKTSENSAKGLLAFLALEGLKSLEWHKYYSWSASERKLILQEITGLIETVSLETDECP